MQHNDVPQTIGTFTLLAISAIFNFIGLQHLNELAQFILHLAQIVAAAMACVVAWHTIKKNLKNKGWVVLPLLILTMAACNTPRAIEQACIKCGKSASEITRVDSFFKVETVVKRDTIIQTKRDESSITALLECDSLGNVLMHIVDSVLNGVAKPSVTITRNILTNKCICDTASIALSWNEKNSVERKVESESKVIIQPEYRDRPLTWWQQFKVDYGGYAFGFIACVILFKIGLFALKTYTKIQLPWT